MNGTDHDFYLLNGNHSVPIAKSILRIGRAEFCDLSPIDPGVSRNHAELISSDDGLKVLDLESTNGTYVNGRRVTECELRVGDELRIAGTTYIIDFRPRGLWERLILAAREIIRGDRDEPSSAPATFAAMKVGPKITGAH